MDPLAPLAADLVPLTAPETLEHIAHAIGHRVRVERLRDVAEPAELVAARLVTAVGASAEEQDGDLASLRVGRELLRDLENCVINGRAPAANPEGSSTVRRTMKGLLGFDAPPKKESQFGEVDIDVPFKVAKQKLVDEFDRRYLQQLLEAHDGNISAAARAAGIERMSIYKMIRRLGLDKETEDGEGTGSRGRAPTADPDEDGDDV